jgi:simple sugar transport system ATP-binding protein
MDEPTAALGVAETAKVEELIRNLSRRGTSIFLVSHNLDQVFRLSSRISILRRGEHVGEFETSKITKNEIVSKITGSLS